MNKTEKKREREKTIDRIIKKKGLRKSAGPF